MVVDHHEKYDSLFSLCCRDCGIGILVMFWYRELRTSFPVPSSTKISVQTLCAVLHYVVLYCPVKYKMTNILTLERKVWSNYVTRVWKKLYIFLIRNNYTKKCIQKHCTFVLSFDPLAQFHLSINTMSLDVGK